jgi:hypothetical protein
MIRLVSPGTLVSQFDVSWPASSPYSTGLTHNRGKRPDSVEVWYLVSGKWVNHYDVYRENDNILYGWGRITIASTSNTEYVTLHRNNDNINTTARIRLFWLAPTDIDGN